MTLPVVISIIAVAVSILSAVAMIYFNSKNIEHTDTKDTEEQMKERIEEIKERTKENAIINAKLDNISSSNMQIKEQISSLVEKVDSHGDRLVKVEESLASAWKRIDEILERFE